MQAVKKINVKTDRARSQSPAKARKSSQNKGATPTSQKDAKRGRSPSAGSKSTNFGQSVSIKGWVKSDSRKKFVAKSSPEKFTVESILEPIKPKNRRHAYTFFTKSLFANANAKNLDEGKKIIMGAGEKWKEMSEKEKQPFVKKADKDAKRHEREMKEYEKTGFFVNEDGVKSTELAMLKRVFKKHVTTPKKLRSPFNFYCKEGWSNMSAKMPEAKLSDVMQALRKEWEKLSDKQKTKYSKMVDADHTRFDRQMNQLLEQGFFINENGAKSVNKKLKTADAPASPEKKASEKAVTASKIGIKRAKESPQKADGKRLKK